LSSDGFGSLSLGGYFVESAGRFIPTDAAGGYWRANTLSGRLVGGLLGLALERAYGGPDLTPARFCVDLIKMAPKAPLTVATQVIRQGRRLLLAEAQLIADGDVVARASCLYLRQSENPEPPTSQSPDWKVPSPNDLPPSPDASHWEIRPIPAAARDPAEAPRRGAAPATGGATSANPPVLGPLSPFEARQAWVRESRPLIEGLAHTPFTRVALAADFASPTAHSSPGSIDFVNCDFTVYLHRLPATEWLGFDMVRHHATAGVAVGECWLHDEQGPLGTINIAAVVQRQA
jgi:acyl-CoA thioesterase